MPQETLTVPRYVYRSVERALHTARQRIKTATERADQLEATLASMRVGKNGAESVPDPANDNDD